MMMTPGELRYTQFSRARFNGYSMAEVDQLLDKIIPDYEALYGENAELRKKVEVLLKRVEAYQEQEDSVKAAILNVQRMCDSIVLQAKQQAALIDQDAKARADKLIEETRRELEAKRSELESLNQEVSSFRSRLVSLYRSHLELIKELPSTAAEPQQTQEDAASAVPAPEAAPAAVPAEPLSDSSAPKSITPVFLDRDDEELDSDKPAEPYSSDKTQEFSLPYADSQRRETANDADSADEPLPSSDPAPRVVEILEEELPHFFSK